MAYDILWKIHGILMSSSFLVMSAGITISLIRNNRVKRYKAHRGLEWYSITSGMIAMATAIIMVQISGGHHLKGVHGYLGLLSFFLFLFTPIFLITRKRHRKKPMKNLHVTLGFLALLSMGIALYSGMIMKGIL